jgi:REP element-mobilizing transposase RayT
VTLDQAEFEFPCQHGGVRRNAGPKRLCDRDRVSHRPRAALKKRHPLHVTLRLVPGLPTLRSRSTHDALLDALVAASDRHGLRVIHYSAQSNHLHLICEAEDEVALARGMKALCVRVARALNFEWLRKGQVFEHRYHCRALETPLDVKNTLAYLFHNARHHGARLPAGIDPFSSAKWFGGWTNGCARVPPVPPRSPFPEPRTWLLAEGWKLHGTIDLFGPR